jgi:cytochrome P450
MEAAVTLALLLRRFDLQLAKTPEEIGKNVLSYTKTCYHAPVMCSVSL